MNWKAAISDWYDIQFWIEDVILLVLLPEKMRIVGWQHQCLNILPTTKYLIHTIHVFHTGIKNEERPRATCKSQDFS